MKNLDAVALETRLSALELEVSRQRDLRDVEDVLVRYSRALDWLDDAAADLVFWDDAEIDYGFFKGNGRAFKPVLMQIERSMGRRWHFTSQVKIALSGDVAEVESYNLTIACESASADRDTPLLQFFGLYLDRVERREGRWAIARRKHLYVAGTSLTEVAMSGDMAALNQIGETSRAHADYRELKETVPGGAHVER